MTFTLETVVPWGRSHSEYIRMFGLNEQDSGLTVLGCADGPASFNAEATGAGGNVISVDPLYHYTREEIEQRIQETFGEVISQTRKNREEFVWEEFESPEQLGEARKRAMGQFLEDYEKGRKEGRYVEASLPELPFDDSRFDLALCSHYLFLYSDHLDQDFHVHSILEITRVAREVRIFPLANLGGQISRHLGPVRERLHDSGLETSVEEVRYEFVRGSNQMLRVSANWK